MAQAGEISILVSVNSDGVKRGINQSTSHLRDGAAELRKSANQWAKWGAAASAAAAVVAAAFVKSSISSTREMRNQALAANASLAEFQSQAFAVKAAGIEQDKYADILKDVNDRVGDFLSTGGGEMAEFFERIAPKVGVTAEQFRNLSGPQALQLYVDTLDRANLSQAEMTFFMEAMANDSTRLIPLLRDGGKAMGEQADEARRLGIVLSDIDAARIEEAGRAMDRIGGIMSGVGNLVAAEVSPIITALEQKFIDAAQAAGGIDEVTENVVNNVIGGFGNVMDVVRGVEVAATGLTLAFQTTGTAIIGVASTILEGWQRLFDQMLSGIQALIDGANAIPGVDIPTQSLVDFRVRTQAAADAQREMRQEMRSSVAQTAKSLHELAMTPLPSTAIEKFVNDARAASESAAQQVVADALPNAVMGGEAANDDRFTQEENEKFLEGLRERFASERELVQMNLEAEMEQLRQAKENELLTEQEFQKRKNQLQADAAKQSADIAKSEARARLQTMSSMMGNLSNLMNTGSRKMFEIGKAAAVAQAVVDGYAAVVGAYKVGASQGGPWLGAAYAATAAASTAAQIQRIKGSSFSSGAGGGSSSFSGGVPAQNTAPAQQQQGGGQGESRNVSISLTGSAFSPDSVRELIREINEQVGDGVNIMAA